MIVQEIVHAMSDPHRVVNDRHQRCGGGIFGERRAAIQHGFANLQGIRRLTVDQQAPHRILTRVPTRHLSQPSSANVPVEKIPTADGRFFMKRRRMDGGQTMDPVATRTVTDRVEAFFESTEVVEKTPNPCLRIVPRIDDWRFPPPPITDLQNARTLKMESIVKGCKALARHLSVSEQIRESSLTGTIVDAPFGGNDPRHRGRDVSRSIGIGVSQRWRVAMTHRGDHGQGQPASDGVPWPAPEPRDRFGGRPQSRHRNPCEKLTKADAGEGM